MNCNERKRLFELKRNTEIELKKFSLPPATKALDGNTPSGHKLSSEWWEKRRKAKKAHSNSLELYQSHKRDCPDCNKK